MATMQFKYAGRHRDVSVKKLTYDSGNQFYDINHFILDSLLDERVDYNNKGEIVAVNFLTTGLLEILFKQHKSLKQLTDLLTGLFNRAVNVPLGRLEYAFHGNTPGSYPDTLRIILEKRNFGNFQSIEHLRVFILKNIVEFWD